MFRHISRCTFVGAFTAVSCLTLARYTYRRDLGYNLSNFALIILDLYTHFLPNKC